MNKPWEGTTGYYAGVGSRHCPAEFLREMTRIADKLGRLGWTLRTGGAEGADTAFLDGCAETLSNGMLYLPWPNFNGWHGRTDNPNCQVLTSPLHWAYPIAEKFHPGWPFLTRGSKALHARNVHQVLGHAYADPHVWAEPPQGDTSRFILCWTPDGADGTSVLTSKKTGGTGMAIRIAAAYGVPVFNLAREDHRKMWKELV